MTDKNPMTTGATSIPVTTGMISLPLFFEYTDQFSLDEFRKTISEMNHLLCLLDDKDIEHIESAIGHRSKNADLNIYTSKRSALRYAYEHDHLHKLCTAFASSKAYLMEAGIEGIQLDKKLGAVLYGDYEIVKEDSGQLSIHFKSAKLKQG
jgi:hypothetical protein